ncbi:MAG: cytochrome C [Campylobacterota bacterium]|nr:cytochrome C [Campylobacterota bacterium]
MNKLLKLAFASAVALSLTTTVASADVTKGQKLYSKKLKKHCGMPGAKMAAQHSQDEWESINENGELINEIKTICPKVKKVKEKYVPHFYDFFYEYANDSGNVPSC